jgi:pSer/pThr/pTyr-binding forkhead associated (FHA) protein
LIGRGETCDLVLPTDDVSREHAVIVRRWSGVQIRDLGSKNGVRVAGQPIPGEQRLRDGDHVEIASFELRLDDPEDRYLRILESPQDAKGLVPGPFAGSSSDRPNTRSLRSTYVSIVVASVVLLIVAVAVLLIVGS